MQNLLNQINHLPIVYVMQRFPKCGPRTTGVRKGYGWDTLERSENIP